VYNEGWGENMRGSETMAKKESREDIKQEVKKIVEEIVRQQLTQQEEREPAHATISTRVYPTLYKKLFEMARDGHMNMAEAMDRYINDFTLTINRLTEENERLKSELNRCNDSLKEAKELATEWENRAMKHLKND
jgi:regulator of replication initiation timing